SPLPVATSRPRSRRRRAKPMTSCSTARAPGLRAASGAAFDRGIHDLIDTVCPNPFLVFAVLDDRAERRVQRVLVDGLATQGGEGLRPVDRLCDARRLVQLQIP